MFELNESNRLYYLKVISLCTIKIIVSVSLFTQDEVYHLSINIIYHKIILLKLNPLKVHEINKRLRFNEEGRRKTQQRGLRERGGDVLMYKIVMLWTFIFDRVIVCKFNAGRGADDTCCAQYTLLFWPVNTGPVFITKLVMIFKNSDFLSLFYKNL